MKYFNTLLLAGGLFALGACSDDTNGFGSTDLNPLPAAISGSYTRLLSVGGFLYAVDNTSIITYDISNKDNPVEVNRTDVGLAVETIFHLDGNLFVGSRQGMFTYTIADDGHPERRGTFDYARVTGMVEPCDPVVANSTTAYATLYTGDVADRCGRSQTLEMLVVMDIRNLDAPELITTLNVRSPRGLSLDGDLLFVCNDVNGFTLINVEDPTTPRVITTYTGLTAWDAIAKDGILIVVGTKELVQYDYSDPTRLIELSRLPYSRV